MNKEMETIKIIAISPKVYLSNVEMNKAEIINHIDKFDSEDYDIIVFPELCLTGYTCGDLFFQSKMIEKSKNAIFEIADFYKKSKVIVIGAPLNINSRIYNCAIVIQDGKIKGIVPKTYLPTYGEFYERRWFDEPSDKIEYWNDMPVGNSLVFNIQDDVSFCIDVCEDIWAPIPPSTYNCLNGANIILNLSASNEIIGKHAYRTELIKNQSGKLNAAYIYVSAGPGESTTDTVYLSNHIFATNGSLICNKQSEDEIITNIIIDYGILNSERKKNTTFRQSVGKINKSMIINCYIDSDEGKKDIPIVKKHPFITSEMNERYKNITKIQSVALKRRLKHIKCENLVIGVSGGLDSTLALMVAVESFKELCLSLNQIHAISMPCFGTTQKTKTNARKLCEILGVDFKEIDITSAVTNHMKNIGADIGLYDLTYENCQARERTQVLMDLATYYKGIVLGTGDMSEMAIGWCTYNGDHMSMYNINCGVPKTLVKHLVSGYANSYLNIGKDEIHKILTSIIETEISPELIPPDKDGNISQKTEEIVGPYELTDFFLFYMMRYDFSDEKIIKMAKLAFKDDYSSKEIENRFKQFKYRFYMNQFKRSCTPDGPKIGSVALSPRADWRMPSDAAI